MAEYHRVTEATPDYYKNLWLEFWEKKQFYPDSFNAHEFVHVLLSPDTVLYEIGDFAGCVFFTAVCGKDSVLSWEEPRASAHILVWDKRYYRREDLVRSICLDAMSAYGLRRLYVQIPDPNRFAYALATRVGFQRVGKIPKCTPMGGKMVDSTVLYALKSDLEKASKEDHDGRHRRVRPEKRRKGRQGFGPAGDKKQDQGHQKVEPARGPSAFPDGVEGRTR